MEYNFNLAALWEFRWAFARSIWITIELSFSSIVIGTIVGLIIGLARQYGKMAISTLPLWAVSTVYVYVMLSIPALVLLFGFYYCLPIVGIRMDSFWTAAFALGLNLSPFAGEIFRSGLSNIPQGELAAAKAMGYSRPQILFFFMLSQFFRNSMPPLMGQYYTTVKMSSLASVIGVYEIINTAQEVINDTYRTLEVYVVVALCYALIVVPFALIAKYYEDRAMIRRL